MSGTVAENRESMLPETVYTPDPMNRRPIAAAMEMLRDLKACRGLARQLLIRNLSARYRQTLLGYVWAIIPAIAMTVTFTLLRSSAILRLGETGIPYSAYVMTGTLLWAAFDGAIKVPLRVAIDSIPMLTKVNFPREALIVAALGEVVFDTSIRLLLMVPVYLWFKVPVPGTIVLAPLGFLAMMGLGLVIGVMFAPLGVLYRDIQKGVDIAAAFLFFLTPVVYPPPESGIASVLVGLNPVSPLVVTGRELLTTGSLTQLPEFMLVIALIAMALPLSWLFFRVSMPHVIERVSA